MIKHASGDYQGVRELLASWALITGEEIVNLSIWMVDDKTWKARIVTRKVGTNAKSKRAGSIHDVVRGKRKRTESTKNSSNFKINRNA